MGRRHLVDVFADQINQWEIDRHAEEAAADPNWPTCARCGGPALGYAQIGGQRLCHSGFGPTCYELGLLDNPRGDRNERSFLEQLYEWLAAEKAIACR
jgi:hypothetical protein